MPETAENRIRRAREASNNPTLPSELEAFLKKHQTDRDLVAEFSRAKDRMLELVADEHPCDDCDAIIRIWFMATLSMVNAATLKIIEASNKADTDPMPTSVPDRLELLTQSDKATEGAAMETVAHQFIEAKHGLDDWSSEFVCTSLSDDPPPEA